MPSAGVVVSDVVGMIGGTVSSSAWFCIMSSSYMYSGESSIMCAPFPTASIQEIQEIDNLCCLESCSCLEGFLCLHMEQR